MINFGRQPIRMLKTNQYSTFTTVVLALLVPAQRPSSAAWRSSSAILAASATSLAALAFCLLVSECLLHTKINPSTLLHRLIRSGRPKSFLESGDRGQPGSARSDNYGASRVFGRLIE